MKNLWIAFRITEKQAEQIKRSAKLDFSAIEQMELCGRKFKYPDDIAGGIIRDDNETPVAWAIGKTKA